MNARRMPVGELRPSQLLYTYGIGAVVDLPHISAMIMGLEDWSTEGCTTVVEDRLLEDVRRHTGPQVERLISPSVQQDAPAGFFVQPDRGPPIGVPVAPFPRWLRCSACNLLAPLSSGLFALFDAPGRPDLARYYHRNCQRAAKPTALPARFLVACPHGHLDDFPWLWFAHRGPTTCHGPLALRELGVSGEARDVEVRCRGCDASPRRMSDAFGTEAAGRLPRCRGRRPHLRDYEEDGCREPAEAILLGASNSWFPVTRSILHVPASHEEGLLREVARHWERVLADVQDPKDLAFLRRRGELAPFRDVAEADLWRAIERHRQSLRQRDSPSDLKRPEWEAFERRDPRQQSPDFKLREVDPPPAFSRWIDRVLLVERLREVTALISFTRLRSPRDAVGPDESPEQLQAPLARRLPTVLPAAEIRGEGLFLRFSEDMIQRYCSRMAHLEDQFEAAHGAWRVRRRHPNPRAGFPGLRYILLHSFSHALMRELSLECGYASASLRERIYADDEDPMAGILIYTAAPDAEGTLGGLVRRGRPDELGKHITRALGHARLCSSDPLCADHRPEVDGSTLHGAACHACLFAPETSCERGNRYLDRATLASLGDPRICAFFDREPPNL